MESKYRIVLLLPYFGKFNSYFDLWIKSCESNSTVDWIIFTDILIEQQLPNNIKVIQITFDELKEKIQKKYDFTISLNKPYKLCDFRPAYGDIFEEYIREYDFWGYCDNDLIFGDIRSFITDDILEKNEKIFEKGHFTLIKNNINNNEIYKYKIGLTYPYKDFFQFDGACWFDESWGRGINKIFKLNEKKIYKDVVFCDLKVSSFSFKYAMYKNINKDKKKKYVLFKWENGKLYEYFIINNSLLKEETMYVHLQKRDMINEVRDTNKFLIINNKFINYNCKLNYNIVKHLVKNKYSIRYTIKYIMYRLKNINNRINRKKNRINL